jgi:hypothetical protein
MHSSFRLDTSLRQQRLPFTTGQTSFVSFVTGHLLPCLVVLLPTWVASTSSALLLQSML